MKQPASPAFLDTSFVVRYLTNDPPGMAELAAAVIDSEEPLVMSEIVILECAYVLTSVYRVAKVEVVEALQALVRRSNVTLVNLTKARALAALDLCRASGRHSFADAMLWAQALHLHAGRIYSFDRKFPSQGLTVTDRR